MVLKNLLDKTKNGTRLNILVDNQEFTITLSVESYDYLKKYLTYVVTEISAGVNVINVTCGFDLL